MRHGDFFLQSIPSRPLLGAKVRPSGTADAAQALEALEGLEASWRALRSEGFFKFRALGEDAAPTYGVPAALVALVAPTDPGTGYWRRWQMVIDGVRRR